MKEYKVFKHPTKGYEAVKQGWSWPAFFFGVIWAFVKGLWQVGLGIFVVVLAISFLFPIESAKDVQEFNVFMNIISVILSIALGSLGNRLRERSLPTRGYTYIDTVIAANPERACALAAENDRSYIAF